MKRSRAVSFLIILIVYVLAIFTSIYSYCQLPFNFIVNLLLADIIGTIVVFIFSLILKNSSTYDPYWSVAPIVISACFLFGNEISISKMLCFIAISIWGIRLTLNWAYTFKNLHHQDWRYTMLKEKTGVFYPIINFLGIHLFPTIVVYLCMLPAVYMFKHSSGYNILTIVFLLVSIFAVIIQGISDYQMHRYRKRGVKGLIREGLWKYSRHPNYLGEIIMWWGILGMYIFTNFNHFYLFLGPLLNTLMFIFISIPLAEGRQKQTKEGFLEYKKETRMLLPIKKVRR